MLHKEPQVKEGAFLGHSGKKRPTMELCRPKIRVRAMSLPYDHTRRRGLKASGNTILSSRAMYYIYVIHLCNWFVLCYLFTYLTFLGEYWNSAGCKDEILVGMHSFPTAPSRVQGFSKRHFILNYLCLLVMPYQCRKSRSMRDK